MNVKEMESLTFKKDNKDIIFQALQEALKIIKDNGQGVLDPVKEMAVKSANAIVTNAETAMKDESLTTMIHSLRTGGTVTLEQIAEKIAVVQADYNNIVSAKDIKAKELEEMFGIEKDLLDIAVVVNTNEALTAKYADEIQALRDEKQELLTSKNEEATQIITDAEAKAKAIIDDAKADKDVKEKEWAYELSRKKITDTDELNDDLAAQKKEWQSEIDETEAEIEEREKAVTNREEAMTSKEEEFAKLRTTVDELPKTISIAVKSAVEKAVKDAEEKATTEANFKDKENAAEKKALDREIEMLKDSNTGKDKTIADLTAKLDAAYDKIQDVANNVANAGRPVVISENQKLGKS